MSILEQQIVIGDKLISNNIRTDPEARSLTMKNGYYENWQYPDNQTATVTSEGGMEDISNSKTGVPPQKKFVNTYDPYADFK
tara:strand:- start:933 stop:1178 length:246 start_codon:yes stop_codon:yes gene_type:complete